MLFKNLLAWMDRQPITFDEISRKQPRYMRAIKVEIAEMENAFKVGDIAGQKTHMVRAQGYYKKAQNIIMEGK